jgi:heme exporter protein D
MNWGSASEFFAMGGYALYVWGSVAITAIVMAAEVIQLKQAKKQLLDFIQTVQLDLKL